MVNIETPKKDPDALLRSLVITAIISMLVILSLTGYGIFRVYKHYILVDAEEDAIGICEALYQAEQDLLILSGSDGKKHLAIEKENIAQLDKHLRGFLHPFRIIKIKIYSIDQKVIYSTDAKIIGQIDSGNVRLKRALSGLNDSKLEKKEHVQDLKDEDKFNVDVVETYIPIFDEFKNVLGSFEVYVDVTRYRQEISNFLMLSVSIMALVLLSVFGLAFVLIRKGTDQLKATQEMLEKWSITDALTGIFNQRQILLRANLEYSKLQRNFEKDFPDISLGFIMIDVDFFKVINDTHGHLVGDSVLQEFAGRIVNSLRDYDEVGRFGGDEFLVILPNSKLDQVEIVADRIWTAIREKPFVVDESSIDITASLGIACVKKEDNDLKSALQRADDGLYKAKVSGRDRIASL